MTTVEAARDMDVLRAALGEAQLLYFGASYGTKLGATYADLFPDKVGRLVLDGAVDLSIDSRQLSLEQAGGFEVALRSYVQNCVDDGDCFLGDTVDDGLAHDPGPDRRRRRRAAADPDGDRELAVGNAFYGLVAPLYNRDYWPILDQALAARRSTATAPCCCGSPTSTSRATTTAPTPTTAPRRSYAINCLDDPYSITADRGARPGRRPSRRPRRPSARSSPGGWSAATASRPRRPSRPREIDGAGAAPIVVVGTTRDPATPYEWAVHLADQLESGVLVSRDGDGHTGYNAGNDCVDEAVEAYLVDGTVPPDGLEC